MDTHSICEIKNCHKAARTKNLCQGHYLRKIRHGDPMGGRWPVNIGDCTVESCVKPAKVSGMCWAHYCRMRKHGDTSQTRCGKAMRWLESMSNHSADECLAYPFLINAQGYGYIGNAEKKGTSLASRIMCILAHGNPPHKDSYACHSCHKGNQGCVNPRHLYWGDNRSNQMDRVENGNSNRGSKHGSSKLSEADVLEIRANLSGKSVVEIANERSLAVSTVYGILSRHRWAWL